MFFYIQNRGDLTWNDPKVKEVWSEYFDKLLNVEFSCSRDMLEPVSPTRGPANNITAQEVREAIAKLKVGKAAGPSGVVAEMQCKHRRHAVSIQAWKR